MTPPELERHVLAMGVAVESFSASDVCRAAELIGRSRADGAGASLSLGDGLCLAVAERLDLPVTGGDQLWATVPLTVPFRPFRT